MAKKRTSRSTSRKTKKSPSRSSRTRKKSASSQASARAKSTARSIRQAASGISFERRLDIAGIILVLIGLLTFLGLLSATRSSLTGTLIGWLSVVFGQGTLLLPIALIVIGMWLMLRKAERIPWPSAERVLGTVLLFLNLVTWLQLIFVRPASWEISRAAAAAGRGGGYVGAGLLEVLLITVGMTGSIVVLAAWMLIALALTLDRGVLSLFAWAQPLWNAASRSLQRARAALARRLQVFSRSTAPRQPAASQQYPTPENLPPAGTVAENSPEPVDFTIAENAPVSWVLPEIETVLEAGLDAFQDDDIDRQRVTVIEESLASFGAPGHVVEINRGPTITQYGVEPDYIENRSGRTRVRVSKIASLADDLALALAAKRIRIQAPVPGKGYIGIEVPNDQPNLVTLRDVIESPAFQRLKSPLRFALGQDVAGQAVAADLGAMPHLLIAGATGSGKSVCVNAIITGLLVNNTPDDLRILMVDPKRVELTGYNFIPHLLAPVVVELERVVGALQWIAREMDQRYNKFARAGARNISDYNAKMEAQGEKRVPYIVVVIDELADLMMLAPDETERNITRLAQLARATGIHLIIATQRPSVDVVTGLIKANFPARVAFAVASGTDSRVILDQPGAERLLGSGDMLFQAPDAPAPVRLQGVFVSDVEIHRVVTHWRAQVGVSKAPPINSDIVDRLPDGLPLKQMALWEQFEPEEEKDVLWDEALDLVRRQGRASISMLQRRLRIGYTRAARLVESMEAQGIVGPPEGGSSAREVLDYGEAGPPVDD